MDIVTLRRVAEHNTYGTAGVMIDPEGVPICLSLELPYRLNARNVSCIPPGKYLCVPENSSKFKQVIFRLHNVPDRSGILIHPVNLATDLEGCIAPGTYFGYLRGKPGVMRSGSALAELRKAVRNQDFLLSIENCF